LNCVKLSVALTIKWSGLVMLPFVECVQALSQLDKSCQIKLVYCHFLPVWLVNNKTVLMAKKQPKLPISRVVLAHKTKKGKRKKMMTINKRKRKN